MYSELAFYINSLPEKIRFWVYFGMIISIPLLLLADHIAEDIKLKRRMKKCGGSR